MGFAKEEKSRRVVRGVKTLFFLITMLISFLLFSAPILLVIADTLLPFSLLSASLSPSSLSSETLSSLFNNYDFRYSLVDIPLISIIRSAVIICVYSLCDGPRLSRGPYLGITTMCSVSSLIYVSFKAPRVFRVSSMDRGEHVIAMEIALFICSLLLAIGHIAVAYRTSCRERRKLLVYKIDIEADDQSRGLSHQRSESWVVASHFLCDLINLVNLPAPNSSVEGSSISSSERFQLARTWCFLGIIRFCWKKE